MSSVKYAHGLDWVTATFSHRDDPHSILPLFPEFSLELQTQGGKHYQHAWRMKCGGVFAYSKDERQGIMIMLPGEALRNLREAGFTDEDTIDFISRAKNVPRLDYRMDVIGGTARDHQAHDAYNAWIDKRIKTRMKLDLSFKDEKVEFGGRSYYFGSKHSDQRIIVYDKADEQGIKDLVWTRVEGRFKNDYAVALVRDMIKYGVRVAGDSKLNSVWEADIEWFQQGLTEEKKILREVPRKEPQFIKWLNRTVEAAIRSNVEKYPKEVEAFYDRIGFMLYGEGKIRE